MTTAERLNHWKNGNLVTPEQHDNLSGLLRKDRFSVFLELSALLYIGVLSLAAGVGLTVQAYFTDLGDVLVLGTLSLLLSLSLYYCFTRASAYSNEETESPNIALDYVLYLGCLLLSVELGYIEFRFHILADASDYYFLLSAVVFFILGYRFDNRFVLSLALSSLGGWFGLKASRFGFMAGESIRFSALLYGGLVATIGTFLHRQQIKRHFLETYLHVAAMVVFIATVSALFNRETAWIYLLLLVALTATSIALGVRFRRFAFVVYGTVFGYIGLSIELLRNASSSTTVLGYLVVTGSIMIGLIAMMARRFGREE